jgi:hypothetical protein
MTTQGPNGSSRREEIHLPGPSLLPLYTAIGITLALLGLIMSWWITAAGGLIAFIAVVRWVSTVGEEIEALPTDRRL